MSAVLTIDGAPRRLRLTLGALARLEQALGAGDFAALSERLARPGAGDLLAIVAALVDDPALDAARLARADIDLGEAARAVAAAFAEGAREKKPAASPGTPGSPGGCA